MRRPFLTVVPSAILLFSFVLVLAAAPGCKKSVGELKTIDIAADAQGDPSHPATVKIDMKVGDLHITPGGGHVVGGTVKSNLSDLDPKVDAAADHVQIAQGTPGASGDWGSEVLADWRLTLGPTPLALAVDTGAGAANLELGGLALKSVRVHSGAGALKASWSAPNQLAADSLEFDSGAGTITLTDVARFGASKIRVHSGAGSIALTLGSKIDRDVELDVEASAGRIHITVPAGTTARADATTAAGGVQTTGWTKDGTSYVVGPPAPNPRVSVKARTGAGTILLDVVP